MYDKNNDPKRTWDDMVRTVANILDKEPDYEISAAIVNRAIVPFTKFYDGSNNKVHVRQLDPDDTEFYGTKVPCQTLISRLLYQGAAHLRSYPMPAELADKLIAEIASLCSNMHEMSQEKGPRILTPKSELVPMQNGIYDRNSSMFYRYHELPGSIEPPESKAPIVYDGDHHASDGMTEIYYALRDMFADNPDVATELFDACNRAGYDKGPGKWTQLTQAFWNAVCDAQIHGPCRGCDGLSDGTDCEKCSRSPGMADRYHTSS